MEIKIGQFIQEHLDAIAEKCQYDDLLFSILIDKEKSDSLFGLGFEFLKSLSDIENKVDTHKRSRIQALSAIL